MERMKDQFVVGRSTLGRDIAGFVFNPHAKRCLLLLGGVHGDEPEGIRLVEEYLDKKKYLTLPSDVRLLAIPRFNVDGCEQGDRRNAHGVDLNRNMPTKDWDPRAHKERYHPGPESGSEVETKLLVELLDRERPFGIVSAHSYDPMINYNGPARAWAEVFSKSCGYRVADDIGYPTPGSLGTYAGWERGIPTITFEVQRDLELSKVYLECGAALEAGIEFAARAKDLSELKGNL